MNKKRLLVCLGALLVLGVLAVLAVPYVKKIMQERQEAKKAAEVKQILTEFHPLLKSLQEAAIKLAETRGTDEERRFTFEELNVPLPTGWKQNNPISASWTADKDASWHPEILLADHWVLLTHDCADGVDICRSLPLVLYYIKSATDFDWSPGDIECKGRADMCPAGIKVREVSANPNSLRCVETGPGEGTCYFENGTSNT